MLRKDKDMSLNWSIDKVENHEELIDGGMEALVTEAIVFHTLAIDMNKITEGNWQEFYARIRIIENMRGASLSVPKWEETDANWLNPDDIIRLPDENPEQLYYFEGTGYDDDEKADILYVYEYEYHEFRGPTKGKSVAFVVDPEFSLIEKHDGFEKRPITPQDVKRRIGLGTNVVHVNRPTWSKRIMDLWINEGINHAGRY